MLPAPIIQVRKTSTQTQQVRVTVTAGPLGLGLSLAEEGSRCVVKGFRPMPDGQPNPGQVSRSFPSPCLVSFRFFKFGQYFSVCVVVSFTGCYHIFLCLLPISFTVWCTFPGLSFDDPPPPPPPHTSVPMIRCAPQEAGVQLGDTLEQLDGVHLGSFQDAIERLKQRRGTVVLTLLRQKD